jgi:hypothetical protein
MKTQKDLGDLPLGDVFRDTSFTKVMYEAYGLPNNFYSSGLMARID